MHESFSGRCISQRILLFTRATTELMHVDSPRSKNSHELTSYFTTGSYQITLGTVVRRRKIFIHHQSSIIWDAHVSYIDFFDSANLLTLSNLLGIEDMIPVSYYFRIRNVSYEKM